MDDFYELEELYQMDQSEAFEEWMLDCEVPFSSESDSDDIDIEVDHETNPFVVVMEQNEVITEKNGVKTFELTDKDRQHIAQILILSRKGKRVWDGRKTVQDGVIKKLAAEYKVHRTTIHRIWCRAKNHLSKEQVIDVSSKKIQRGRKRLGFDPEVLGAVPIEKRTTIRSLAEALGLGFSTVYRLLRAGLLRAHSNSIKPLLKHHHKITRVQYIMQSVILGCVNELPKFSAMYNMVHINEKWFFMSAKTQRFYLFPWEDDPYRATQSKKFIEKVMFGSGVARPHITQQGEEIWDGKIGIFPFVEGVAAQRSSKNRAKGTIETKAIQPVTKDVIRSMLINEMLPAIREKWPIGACKDIWIQQDNARPHISPTDKEFIEAATKDGFNIRLVNQPAQSPDLNILDLGFFRAIQSIQYKEFPRSIDDLIKAVTYAYNEFDARSLNYTWLHMQYCMLEVLQVNGGNKYKNPHKGKKRLERLGLLPVQLEVPCDLLGQAFAFLNEGHIEVNVAAQQGNIEDNMP